MWMEMPITKNTNNMVRRGLSIKKRSLVGLTTTTVGSSNTPPRRVIEYEEEV